MSDINDKKRIDVVEIRMVKDHSIPYGGQTMSSPKAIAELARGFIGEEAREMVVAIYLDVKYKATAIHTVSVGNASSSLVHPREVFKAAILSNASSIILVHNHPSGDPTPSFEDGMITEKIQNAGKIMGIPLADHVIIGDEGAYYSFKEYDRI